MQNTMFYLCAIGQFCLTREILDQTDINLTVHLQLTTDIFMQVVKCQVQSRSMYI